VLLFGKDGVVFYLYSSNFNITSVFNKEWDVDNSKIIQFPDYMLTLQKSFGFWERECHCGKKAEK
jgi:hypothetical protein